MATINEELMKLESTKADIKSALVEKGQNPTDEFSSYAQNIRNIQSGGSIDQTACFVINNSNKDNIVWPTNWANYKYILISEDIEPYGVLNIPDLTVDYNNKLLLDTNPQGIPHWINWNLTINVPGYSIEYLYGMGGYHQGSSGDQSQLFNITYKGIGQDEVNASGCLSNLYGNVKVTFDNIKIKNALRMFQNSYLLGLELNGDFSQCITVEQMFDHANDDTELELNLTFPSLNLSQCTNFNSMFNNCYLFNEILPLDTSNSYNLSYMFLASPIIKIHEISVKNSESNDSMFGHSWSPNPIPRYILIKDIGYRESLTGESFYKTASNWGVEDSTIPLSVGARQSVIDSLITYSFDRAAAGYPTYTISLSTNTKALLTEEEIAQITAKGFTIA